jgi:hypothetical protein
MAKHYIYHIIGKKVGCTKDIPTRMKRQGVKEGEYEILEEHTNAKVASVREMELQKEYGYKVDRIAYWKTIRNQKPEKRKEIQNNIDWSDRYKAIQQLDEEGNIIAEYKCGADAAVAMGKSRKNDDIRKVARGENITAFGYYWKFIK